MWEPEFLYEPLPIPDDHPELGLFSQELQSISEGLSGTSIPAALNERTGRESEAAFHPRVADEPLPARMLNEYVYCPRLFYYEHVDGVFLESADTERGSAIHKKVDKGRGDLPPPKAAQRGSKESQPAAVAAVALAPDTTPGKEPQPADIADADAAQEDMAADGSPKLETIHSRSATLGSERLGVLAKMDLIEVQMVTVAQDRSSWVPVTSFKDAQREASPSVTAPMPSPPSPPDDSPPLDTQSGTMCNLTKRTSKKSRPAADQPDLFAAAITPPPAAGTAIDAPCLPAPVAPTARLLHVELKQRVVHQVTPVDYKLGAPRRGEDGNEMWEADKMQLGLQILILRDNGYTCDEGVIYYRATKQRVPLAMTDELEGWIIGKIAEARQVAASRSIPPPLMNSPKCVRCSLAPVCLPDETRLLKRVTAPLLPDSPDRSADKRLSTMPPPRRLMAPRDDERALYLNTQGARVTLRGEVVVVKEQDSVLGEFRLKDLSHVALFGNIQITTQTVQMLCEAEIPVAYFSMGGWFYGLTRGHGLKNVYTRIEQFQSAQDPHRCLALAQRFIHGKIRNHRTQLMRNHVNLPDGVSLKMKRAAGDVLAARSLGELLGMEGAAAAMYFQNFAGMIKVGADDDELPGLEPVKKADRPDFTFDFTKRARRPPTDPVNALLSLAYSLLAKDCTLAALAVGFDPYIGFFHQPRHGRPALALDLMEEFRPLIAESAVLTALNNRMINPGHFVRAGEAVNLTVHGRKAFFQAYEQRMSSLVTHPIFDYKASYRRVLELQARMLARYLTSEIPEYVPMMTR
ncbi:CRISPR-associated endonuclease Cas1 [Prosthecobacter fusiformis]|uniref:CRISPR-associated endonuclease Cas1 n=2 Tax=Prosthecobacter fusiformis TaxID=48464 RepID=A0A4R7RNW0_9BACT|nr:CRISPR-associated endonuclease Cas1 [Prosthecobacter fusiformis]